MFVLYAVHRGVAMGRQVSRLHAEDMAGKLGAVFEISDHLGALHDHLLRSVSVVLALARCWCLCGASPL